MKISESEIRQIIKEEIKKLKENYKSGIDLDIPIKDMGKVKDVLKKLKLKPNKDFNIGVGGAFGSGKTFVTRSAFGGTGLKLVNSDAEFERVLKKAGVSLKMPYVEEYFRNIVRA